MMKYPKVTVLVTVKNMEGTIEKCVKSLLSLDYPNYRIFITDAYSTDRTFEILKKIKKRYPKKLRLEQFRGTIAAAHNYMISRANTEFVAMSDADCVVDRKWLKNLISAFTSNDIIASTGFCSTPKSAKRFQKLIGMELEDRFKHAKNFVLRGPTMNLAVRTKFAKEIKFDEKFDVAQETDWGYRLTKLGKMAYVPKAIVYHYHRSTLFSFLKQHGFRYGKSAPRLYLKHFSKAKGDHLTKETILLQEYYFWIFCLSILLSFLYNYFILSIILSIPLLFLYIYDILRFTKNPFHIISFIFIYFLRNIAYTIGMLVGIADLIIKR